MSKLKISELFYSIQGEGRFMGVPSVFLRTYGCNFTCGGFGMPKGELSVERDKIDAESFTNYKSLPLVSSGCDSYASWDPRFKHLSPVLDSDSIVSGIMDILPFDSWVDEHLVITGGEPLLGWQRAYPDLLSHTKMIGLKELTFETNGTQELSPEFRQYLLNWTLNSRYHDTRKARGYDKLTFSVSPKLSGSGEKHNEAIRPEIVLSYEDVGYTYLKFVIATEEDFADAISAAREYRAAGFKGPVYLMPVGGTESVYTLNNRRVADFAVKAGLRYSDRLQVPLFKNEWGT